MDDQTPNFGSIRRRPIAALVLGAAFGAVLVTRFLPAFVPDYSGLNAIPAQAREALGCLDHETAVVIQAMHAEAFPHDRDADGRRLFLDARSRGLEAAGRIAHMAGCAEALASSSPALARKGNVEEAVAQLGETVIEVYTARAALIAATHGVPAAAPGEVDLARASVAASWERAEKVATSFSEWIAVQVAAP